MLVLEILVLESEALVLLIKTELIKSLDFRQVDFNQVQQCSLAKNHGSSFSAPPKKELLNA